MKQVGSYVVVTDSRNMYDKLETKMLVIKRAKRHKNVELLALEAVQWNTAVTYSLAQVTKLATKLAKNAKICQDSTVLVWQCNRQLSRVFMIFLDEHSTVANSSSKAWTCVAQLDVEATMAYTRGHP